MGQPPVRQRLKPRFNVGGICGTAEAVPFHETLLLIGKSAKGKGRRDFSQRPLFMPATTYSGTHVARAPTPARRHPSNRGYDGCTGLDVQSSQTGHSNLSYTPGGWRARERAPHSTYHIPHTTYHQTRCLPPRFPALRWRNSGIGGDCASAESGLRFVYHVLHRTEGVVCRSSRPSDGTWLTRGRSGGVVGCCGRGRPRHTRCGKRSRLIMCSGRMKV
jgi:hypothetical protein